jgi:hypothetical protein
MALTSTQVAPVLNMACGTLMILVPSWPDATYLHGHQVLSMQPGSQMCACVRVRVCVVSLCARVGTK